jgi:hypothetical protein
VAVEEVAMHSSAPSATSLVMAILKNEQGTVQTVAVEGASMHSSELSAPSLVVAIL